MNDKNGTFAGGLLAFAILALTIGTILVFTIPGNLVGIAFALIAIGALCLVSGLVFLIFNPHEPKKEISSEAEIKSIVVTEPKPKRTTEVNESKVIKKIRKRLINYAIQNK